MFAFRDAPSCLIDLDLGSTIISSSALGSLPLNLRSLSLEGTRNVDDQALEHFQALHELKQLNLKNSGVTDQEAIRRVLSHCEVTF
jgi:hypothetical protein